VTLEQVFANADDQDGRHLAHLVDGMIICSCGWKQDAVGEDAVEAYDRHIAVIAAARIEAVEAEGSEADHAASMDFTDEFLDWLHVGQEKGWISTVLCGTHDGIPSSKETEEAWDEGYDPCEPILRIWRQGETPARGY
jgi:hypothetical protein